MTDKLKAFEGKEVTGVQLTVTGLGDGLSKAMEIESVELKQGTELYVLVKAVVQKVRHDPADKDKPGGKQVRVHIARAETALVVDEEFAKDEIVAQEAKYAEALRLAELEAEAAEGVQRLEGT